MPISNLRALEVARDKQIQTSNELSERVNELREAGKSGETYTNACLDFKISEDQVKLLDRQIEEASQTLGSTRTERKNAIEASPSLRFMNASVKKRDGRQGLEAHEIEAQNELVGRGGFENIYRDGDYIMPVRAAFTTTQADELIQTDVMSDIVEKLVNFGGARKMAGIIQTSGGNPIKVPNADESGQEGELIAENATAAEQANQVPTEHTLGASTFSSRSLSITKQAIADTGANGFDLVGYQIRQAARRLGRTMNRYFTVGTGTNQPQGIVTSAGQHAQIVGTGGVSGLAYSDLVKLVGSIDSAYLEGGETDPTGSNSEAGMTGWMFHQAFETQLMLLEDSDGRSLWSPGLTAVANSPRMNSVLGYPYVTNNSMDGTIATGANKVACVFGNIGGYFKIRQIDSILIRQYDDSGTAPTNTILVLGYARADSRCISHGATSDSYKRLTTKA